MKKILLGSALLGVFISGSLFAGTVRVERGAAYFPKENPPVAGEFLLPRQMLTAREYNLLINVLTGVVRKIDTVSFWGIGWGEETTEIPRTHLDVRGALEVEGLNCATGNCCNLPASCDDDHRGTICFTANNFYGCNQNGWVQLNL